MVEYHPKGRKADSKRKAKKKERGGGKVGFDRTSHNKRRSVEAAVFKNCCKKDALERGEGVSHFHERITGKEKA